MIRAVEVAIGESGWRTTVQDLGRVGTERAGVPRGGAADQLSARVANILVGNAQSAPLIESLGGTLVFTADEDVLVSATGSVADFAIDGCSVDHGQPIAVPKGVPVRVVCSEAAARTYVALSGALRTPRLLGSAAPDPRMGFTQALNSGTMLTLDTAVTHIEQPTLGRALFRLPTPLRTWDEEAWTIDLVECAETDRIPGIRDLVASSEYTVDMRSDHVGVRLDGPVLHPADADEIVSHGVPIGAVEIPHGDEVIVLGRYRTLTAGYPIVGFATRTAQSLMGQVRPGRTVRFRWVDRGAARAQALAREAELALLEAAAIAAFDSLGMDVTTVRALQTAAGAEQQNATTNEERHGNG